LDEFIPHLEEVHPFSTGSEKSKAVLSGLARVFRTKTRDEWVEIMRQKDTCVAPVYSIDEVIFDPQVLERDMVVEIDHPKLGKVKQLGIPVKLSETPGAIRRLPPRRGEHTEEILLELGYTRQDIDELRAKEAIK